MTAAALPDPLTVTEPGVYDGMTDAVYHAPFTVPGGSLSASGAKLLLPPSCPALYKHARDHGRSEKRAYDVGHVAHTLILGTGAPAVVVAAKDWRTKAAQQKRDEAYAAGQVPLLVTEYDAVCNMAAAVGKHEHAAALFADGVAERSLFWHEQVDADDTVYTAWRRARPDWQTTLPSGQPAFVDLKTCQSAEPSAIAKAVHNYGYYQQAPFYIDGARAVLGLDPVFLFVFVEKEPPHLVTVCELSADAVEAGRRRNERALSTYARCQALDEWPGYTDDIPVIGLPAWAREDDET